MTPQRVPPIHLLHLLIPCHLADLILGYLEGWLLLPDEESREQPDTPENPERCGSEERIQESSLDAASDLPLFAADGSRHFFCFQFVSNRSPGGLPETIVQSGVVLDRALRFP